MSEKIINGFDVTKEIIERVCKNCESCEALESGYICNQILKNDSPSPINNIDAENCMGSYFVERTSPPLKIIPKVLFPMLSQKLDLYKQVSHYVKTHPVYYDKSKVWWLWNRNKMFWERVDETDILIAINTATDIPNVHSSVKAELLEAFKQLGRKHAPKKAKKTWIQFRDIIYDIKTKKKIEISPKYFVTNPIPWKLSNKNKTPTIDKIFEQWVGKDYKKTLYEIMAYCMLPDYPIHRLFCLLGSGMNGKSCFLRLLKKFIGLKNTTAANLDKLIISNFEKTRLHKKLVCFMSETNITELNQTSALKELTGGDLTGFEYKNKDPFEDINYAKIIISTNNLPTTTDKTIGYYRRWLIIDFSKQFSEKIDIIDTIPKEEYKNLTLKCIKILKKLLEKRTFFKEGSVEDRQKKYEDRSNPFDKFWGDNIDDSDSEGWIGSWEFKKKLDDWCKENNFRSISERTNAKHMKEKEVEASRQRIWSDSEKTNKQFRCWRGIKWKQ